MVRARGGCAAIVAAVSMLGCVAAGSDGSWSDAERRRFVRGSHGPLSERVSPAELTVFVPLGVDRGKLAIAARDRLVFGPGARLLFDNGWEQSAVASMGQAWIGQGAQLGALYGEGTLTTVEDGAHLRGYLEGCGTFQIGAARIDVGVLHRPRCELDEFQWRVAFPDHDAGNRTSRALDPAPLDLAPGGYDRITVEPFSVLRVHSGRYYFNSLDVEQDGALELDNTLGPIEVWVRDRLQLSNGTIDYSLQPSIFFGYAGESPPAFSAELRGTFVAPAATLELPATERPHSGAFFARSITLAANARVEHRPLSKTPINAGPASVCAQCAESARTSSLECCRRLNRSLSASTADSSLGEASCATESAQPIACMSALPARLA